MNPEQKPQLPTDKLSLREIRLLYLRGKITWETYRTFERAMSIQFGDDPRQPVLSPKSAELKEAGKELV